MESTVRELAELYFKIAECDSPIELPVPPSYTSPETGRNDPVGGKFAVMGRHIFETRIEGLLRDFGTRRGFTQQSVGKNIAGLTRFFSLCCRTKATHRLPVVVWDCAHRTQANERKTIDFRFGVPEVRGLEEVPLYGSSVSSECVNDDIRLDALRRLISWQKPCIENPVLSVIRYKIECIKKVGTSFAEWRESFGYIAESSLKQHEWEHGFFPCQREIVSTLPGGAGWFVNQPFITIGIFDEPLRGQPREWTIGRAYTTHIDPSTGEVACMLSYMTPGFLRLACMPDVVAVVPALRSLLALKGTARES